MECSTTTTLHTAKEFSRPFSNMDLIKLKGGMVSIQRKCYRSMEFLSNRRRNPYH